MLQFMLQLHIDTLYGNICYICFNTAENASFLLSDNKKV